MHWSSRLISGIDALLADAVASLKAIASDGLNLGENYVCASTISTQTSAKFQADFSTLSTDISNAISALQSGLEFRITTPLSRLRPISWPSLDSQLMDMDSKLKAQSQTLARLLTPRRRRPAEAEAHRSRNKGTL